MSTKIRLFNRNFSQSFQRKFDKVILQGDGSEPLEAGVSEKQIGYVYLLLQPYVTNLYSLLKYKNYGYIPLKEMFGVYKEDDIDYMLFPHLRLKFKTADNLKEYETELNMVTNNMKRSSTSKYSGSNKYITTNDVSNNIFGSTYTSGWTNKATFYGEHIVDGIRTGITIEGATSSNYTFYPLTFTNESYYYSGVGGTYSIDGPDTKFTEIDGVLTDYSYRCPTNAQFGGIWDKGQDTENRGIYCFGNSIRFSLNPTTYGTDDSDIQTRQNLSNESDINGVITTNQPYYNDTLGQTTGIIYRRTPFAIDTTQSNEDFFINSADEIFGSFDLSIDNNQFSGNMPSDENQSAGMLYKKCSGQVDNSISVGTASENIADVDLANMMLASGALGLNNTFSTNGKHYFLLAIPFELEKIKNSTEYRPILKENADVDYGFSSGLRKVDLTKPISLDLIWSVGMTGVSNGTGYDFVDEIGSFKEENEEGSSFQYLKDSDPSSDIRILDNTELLSQSLPFTEGPGYPSYKSLRIYERNGGDIFWSGTDSSPIKSGIIPLAMKTVFLVQDDCFEGNAINYEQNIDYIFTPNININIEGNFRNFNCNPYSATGGNIYVSMYPDFGIGIDINPSQAQ